MIGSFLPFRAWSNPIRRIETKAENFTLTLTLTLFLASILYLLASALVSCLRLEEYREIEELDTKREAINKISQLFSPYTKHRTYTHSFSQSVILFHSDIFRFFFAILSLSLSLSLAISTNSASTVLIVYES